MKGSITILNPEVIHLGMEVEATFGEWLVIRDTLRAGLVGNFDVRAQKMSNMISVLLDKASTDISAQTDHNGLTVQDEETT